MKIQATLDQVNSALRRIGQVGDVRLNSDAGAGSFQAKGVRGRFSFDQASETLEIAIDDKPFLASTEMIEEKIREFFNS